MHTADGEDYYDCVSRECRPEDRSAEYISFLQSQIKALEEENADLRKRCGIKKRIYNGHLGTMCEED